MARTAFLQGLIVVCLLATMGGIGYLMFVHFAPKPDPTPAAATREETKTEPENTCDAKVTNLVQNPSFLLPAMPTEFVPRFSKERGERG